MGGALKKANRFLMPNYGELGLEITSGQGAWVWTRNAQGKRKKCLDLLCGLGVTSLGHCHPEVVKAIEKQSQKLMHVSNLYATGPMAELAAALAEKNGDNTNVFFCNSGTEAVEAAVKLARIWAYEKFGHKKNKIIYFKNSFHGRTWMSISLTGQAKMQEKFGPVVEGIVQAEFNSRTLSDFVDHDTCAIIFEIVQTEGGVNVITDGFYDEILRLSKEYNFLKIVDEVQTGVGRTGEFFAHWHFKGNPYYEVPEIITMAKALGGGLPIGAVLARGEVGDYLLPGSHAATFGGNPVACAAGLAVLKIIERQNLMARVEKLGLHLLKRRLFEISCEFYDKIKEYRGGGFMFGVELHEPYKAVDVVKAMYEKGVLLGTAGPQVVRFLPPFIITEEELDKALQKFEQVIKDL
ncbi:MAG: acetylornithine/succinylornithine family transaminase [Candidatus Buchananbacteria bacterium]|nr:acetylornithine/succinylornithine family transaminase [Candidatus Buchananbacteria bacterium]